MGLRAGVVWEILLRSSADLDQAFREMLRRSPSPREEVVRDGEDGLCIDGALGEPSKAVVVRANDRSNTDLSGMTIVSMTRPTI